MSHLFLFKYHHMGFDMFHNLGPYTKTLKCYSVIMMGGKERHDVDKGGKSKSTGSQSLCRS